MYKDWGIERGWRGGGFRYWEGVSNK